MAYSFIILFVKTGLLNHLNVLYQYNSYSGHTYKVFIKLYFNLDHEKQVIFSFISPKDEK
jgi:hypothetical protein